MSTTPVPSQRRCPSRMGARRLAISLYPPERHFHVLDFQPVPQCRGWQAYGITGDRSGGMADI